MRLNCRKEPTIAVVTATKNRRKLLSEAIASVRAQTFTDWEHWIVDDGSDDDTESMVRRLSDEDPRFHYLKRAGDIEGANVCRNIGVRATSAEFVVFLDSDDLLEACCLQGRVDIMSRNPDLDFVVFPAGIFESKVGDIKRLYCPDAIGDDLTRFLYLDCPWETTGPVWRREYICRLGLFEETLRSMQDVDLHFRAICDDARYIKCLNVDHHIRWRSDPERTSVRHFTDPIFIEKAEKIPFRFRSILENKGLLNWSRLRALAGLSFRICESWARIGRLRDSFRAWAEARNRKIVDRYTYLFWKPMLLILWLIPQEDSLGARLANKFKGLFGFRGDPLLPEYLKHSTTGGEYNSL
jgi:glycosyltransferase involved in cell wall biosynthesis